MIVCGARLLTFPGQGPAECTAAAEPESERERRRKSKRDAIRTPMFLAPGVSNRPWKRKRGRGERGKEIRRGISGREGRRPKEEN